MGKQAEHPGHPAGTGALWKRTVHSLLIVLVAVLAYSNTFDVPFHFDDTPNIVANSLIRDFSNFLDPARARGHPYYDDFKMRYVGFLSFAVNYKLHGLKVPGFHGVNLLIHVLNGLLVYFLVVATLRTPKMRPAVSGDEPVLSRETGTFPIPLFAALLFAAHPIQTQAVTYIVQRFASLAALFYLAALLAYARSRLLSGQAPRALRRGLYFLGLLCTILAMKTKEPAFTLPLSITLYELLFFPAPSASRWKRLRLLLPFVLTLGTIPLSALDLSGAHPSWLDQLEHKSRILTTLSRQDYFLTQLTVIPVYLRLLFLPAGQNLDHDHPVVRVFLDPRVVLSSLLILCVLLTGVYALRASRFGDPRWRLTAFGIFWFFLTLLPESSIIPIVDVLYEHRLYLPSVGAFLSIASGLSLLEGRPGRNHPRTRLGMVLVGAAVVFALSAATYARNEVWRDEVTLWEDVVSKSPNKDRPHNTLGSLYLNRDRPDLAYRELCRTLEINPDYWAAHVNLGSWYMMEATAAARRREPATRVLERVEKGCRFLRTGPGPGSGKRDDPFPPGVRPGAAALPGSQGGALKPLALNLPRSPARVVPNLLFSAAVRKPGSILH
ncbi:MAG TPA: hypothetical protein PLM79_10795 [Syntrophobacteraceae bacterium]|nr:hypothetical protein [Syntrophobacteraceae bacterium]